MTRQFPSTLNLNVTERTIAALLAHTAALVAERQRREVASPPCREASLLIVDRRDKLLSPIEIRMTAPLRQKAALAKDSFLCYNADTEKLLGRAWLHNLNLQI